MLLLLSNKQILLIDLGGKQISQTQFRKHYEIIIYQSNSAELQSS